MNKNLLLTILILFVGKFLIAQCETFRETEIEDKLMESFVLYKDYLRLENFEEAYKQWKFVYQNSPAADGKRSSVYFDGVLIMVNKFENEFNSDKKKEIARVIFKLIDEQLECYPDSELYNLEGEILNYRSKNK